MFKSVFTFIFLLCFSASAFAGNLYETLGISSDATRAEIKSAWKKLVLQYHPDKFMNDPAAAKAANEKLAVINAAETVLGNETLRAYYDYLSYKGKNHNRWASIPENQNAATLEKRFGTVDYIKIKYTEPSQAKPQSKAQAQAKPQPKPAEAKPEQKPQPQSETKASEKPKTQQPPPQQDSDKPPTTEQLLQSFKKEIFSSATWGDLPLLYLKQNPTENSSVRQAELLEILMMPFQDKNLERIAFIAVKTFEINDAGIFEKIEGLINSKNPSFKKIGVALIQYALSESRTQQILGINSSAAENLLIERLNDKEKIVADRSRYAVQKLKIKVQKNYDALSVIAKLSDPNTVIKDSAFAELFSYDNFSNEELKALNKQLLAKKAEYEKYSQQSVLLEMTAIIEIFESASDLSAIAEEFKTYRNNLLGKDLVLRAYALEKRIDAQSSRYPICRKIFN